MIHLYTVRYTLVKPAGLLLLSSWSSPATTSKVLLVEAGGIFRVPTPSSGPWRILPWFFFFLKKKSLTLILRTSQPMWMAPSIDRRDCSSSSSNHNVPFSCPTCVDVFILTSDSALESGYVSFPFLFFTLSHHVPSPLRCPPSFLKTIFNITLII